MPCSKAWEPDCSLNNKRLVSSDSVRRAVEQQDLALLIIRQILLLRFSPLQRRMALKNLSRSQVSALLHALANCMSDPTNFLMCAGNDKHFAAWISRQFSIGRCHRLRTFQVWNLAYGPELLKFLKPLFGRLAQCLNSITVFSLCLPLYASKRDAFHLRFTLQDAQGVRCFDALDLPCIARKENARALALRHFSNPSICLPETIPASSTTSTFPRREGWPALASNKREIVIAS